MQVFLDENGFRLQPGSEADASAIQQFLANREGFVFLAVAGEEDLELRSLGPREVACRRPINVTSAADSESVRLIANFADTPFYLHERWYGSVEGFWQSLKFRSDADRRRVGML